MDWKEVLAQMGGKSDEQDQAAEQENLAKGKRKGVVYSTDPSYEYTSEDETPVSTLPKEQQPLRVSMERSGRGGKTVTLVRGFVGSESDLQSLGKLLKQRLGVGGSVKDGEIIVQGDHRGKLTELLKQLGYRNAKGGN